MACWTARFTDPDVRLAWDPAIHTGSEFPHSEVPQVLDGLARDGWEIVSVSEDRGVDDDATVSFVGRARYLLRRNA